MVKIKRFAHSSELVLMCEDTERNRCAVLPSDIGKNVLFVSNNASKSRAMFKKTFDSFDIPTTEVSPGAVTDTFGSSQSLIFCRLGRAIQLRLRLGSVLVEDSSIP
jgi:hypothetical protein